MKTLLNLIMLIIYIIPAAIYATAANQTPDTFEALNKERQFQCPKLEKISAQTPYTQQKLNIFIEISKGNDICATEAIENLEFFYLKNIEKHHYWKNVGIKLYKSLIEQDNPYAIAKVCASFGMIDFPDNMIVDACNKLLINTKHQTYLQDAKNAAIENLFLFYFKNKNYTALAQTCNDYILPSKTNIPAFIDKNYCERISFNLANAFVTGTDGFEINYQKGFLLFKKLLPNVNQPEIKALIYRQLGIMYGNGVVGIPQDIENAIDCFKKSLSFSPNNTQTLYDMAILYEQLHQYPKAFSAFLSAAQLGLPSAQGQLAYFYAKGFGVLQDYKQAYAWLTIAIAGGLDTSDQQTAAEKVQSSLILALQAQDKTGGALKEAQNLAQQYYDRYVLHGKTILSEHISSIARVQAAIKSFTN